MSSETCNAFIYRDLGNNNYECEFRNCPANKISIPTQENDEEEGYYITNGKY